MRFRCNASHHFFGTDYAFHRYAGLESACFRCFSREYQVRSGRNIPPAIVSDGIALKKDYCSSFWFSIAASVLLRSFRWLSFLGGMFLPERVFFKGEKKMFYAEGDNSGRVSDSLHAAEIKLNRSALSTKQIVWWRFNLNHKLKQVSPLVSYDYLQTVM